MCVCVCVGLEIKRGASWNKLCVLLQVLVHRNTYCLFFKLVMCKTEVENMSSIPNKSIIFT